MLPFQLESGIYLENVKVLVPWGTEIRKLREFGSPVVTEKAGGVWVDWRGARCLGGLVCKVGACQLTEPATPNAYHVFLPEFHWAHLTLGPEGFVTRDLLRSTFRHLKANLGPPHYFYAGYSAGLPSIWWEFERVKVGIGPEYGSDSGSVTVGHEPSGFEDLRRGAAEWEAQHGVGAREDYREGAVGF
jgi:hypothetical protein